MTCATCSGRGIVPDADDDGGLVVCDECGGAGEIENEHDPRAIREPEDIR